MANLLNFNFFGFVRNQNLKWLLNTFSVSVFIIPNFFVIRCQWRCIEVRGTMYNVVTAFLKNGWLDSIISYRTHIGKKS